MDQRGQKGQKEQRLKIGLYFGGEAEGTKGREDFPLDALYACCPAVETRGLESSFTYTASLHP